MNINVNALHRDFGLRAITKQPSILKSLGKTLRSFAIGLENAREMQIQVEEGKPVKKAFKAVYGIDLSRQ